MPELDPRYSCDRCHETILAERKPALAYHPGVDYDTWKAQIRARLRTCLGDEPEAVPMVYNVLSVEETETYIDKRLEYLTEKDTWVPCHYLMPKNPCAEKVPLVICLQGHSSGMHISLGKPIYDGDQEIISGGDRDFALQIVKRGYAALVLEQRGFGERKTPFEKGKTTCSHIAMVALMLGRTMLGERVWDISRAIDLVSTFPEVDTDRICCMGNSGGGTATYYAACMDERIRVAMPSCSVCTYRHSIGAMRHCDCNYLPNAAKYFDMGDLACLIAPRALVIVSGIQDPIFPHEGVEETYETIQAVYEHAGAGDKCAHIIGPEGHRFYADLSWDTFDLFLK